MMNLVNYIKRTVKSLHHNCTCGPVVGGVGRVLIGVRREMQRSPCRTARKSSQIGLWQALLIRRKRASLPHRLDAGKQARVFAALRGRSFASPNYTVR